MASNFFMDYSTKEGENPLEYWCSWCDVWTVNSNQPETGKFFTVFGQLHTQEGPGTGNQAQVTFAICTHCLKELDFGGISDRVRTSLTRSG